MYTLKLYNLIDYIFKVFQKFIIIYILLMEHLKDIIDIHQQ